MEDDVEGLSDFRDCLMTPGVALTTVDLLYNRIGESRLFGSINLYIYTYVFMYTDIYIYIYIYTYICTYIYV
jgi:hypothetical protein